MRRHLQRLGRPVLPGNGGAEHHPAAGGLFLRAGRRLVGKPVLHVDVPLLQYAHAVARDGHVVFRLQLHLDVLGALQDALHARGRVFARHLARLVEDVRRRPAHVRPDVHQQRGRFVVADQPHHRKAVAAAVLHRAARPLRLVASPVLLLRLRHYLQLYLAVARADEGGRDARDREATVGAGRHPERYGRCGCPPVAVGRARTSPGRCSWPAGRRQATRPARSWTARRIRSRAIGSAATAETRTWQPFCGEPRESIDILRTVWDKTIANTINKSCVTVLQIYFDKF